MNKEEMMNKISDKWVPCSRELPNNTFPVLVSVNVRGIMNIITTRTAWFNSVKKVWIVHHEDNEVIGEVIAWQPLPKPYKESEVEE